MKHIKWIHLVGALALALLSGPIWAGPTNCPAHYVGGIAPDVADQKSVKELCSQGFAVGYSPTLRTPLWSAEHILPSHVLAQEGLKRDDAFHADARLAPSDRAELKDFQGSEFDRGHMTPSASAWNMQVQAETFALSNMVPQNPENNRGLHAHIEMAVRDYAKKNGDVFVITGPLFKSEKLQMMNLRVAVPSHIYKLVFDPRKRQAVAFVEANTAVDAYKTISVAELEKLAGIKFFPKQAVVGKLLIAGPVVHVQAAAVVTAPP